MPKINTLIPPQRYELVRDRIGEILAEELLAQFGLHHNLAITPKVWIERFVPFNHTEVPAVAVYVADGAYSGKDQISVTGHYNYYVDCLTAAASTTGDHGDKLARINLQRILGMCRAILENPVYRTLDFPAPMVGGLAITAIQVSDPNERQEATNQAYGRLTLAVAVEELVSIEETGIPLAGSATTVTLHDTDKGYVWLANSDLVLGTEALTPLVTETDDSLRTEPAFS